MDGNEQKELEKLSEKLIENAKEDLENIINTSIDEMNTNTEQIIYDPSMEKSMQSGRNVMSILNVILILIIFIVSGLIKSKINPKDSSKKKKNANYKKNKGMMEDGIVIGQSDEGPVVKSSKKPGHVLICGGSGKGKSQAVTIPSLLNWDGAALVIDIKRELYAYTYQARSQRGNVIVFDPEQQGHGYDPVQECYTVDGCQFLARSLVPTPPNSSDPFWTGNAQSILAAACYEGNKKGQTLPEIAERILTTEPQILVDELINSEYKETQLLASSLRGTPEKTLGGIFTELKSKLITIATDPNLRQALSKSEWKPETLEEGTTIYMRVSEKQIEQYKQIWNVIIVQIIRYLSSRPDGKNPPILMLLDELPRLGKVEGYSGALATLRSRNVHIVSAIQSVAQLDEHYGKEVRRTIMDNKAYKLVLSASDNETQKIFSELAGKDKLKQKSTSINFGGGAGISQYEQWEERFRPEIFAYMEKPIYYPTDGPAYEIEKVFWMDMPKLLNLQKQCGGPITFLTDQQMQELSTFRRLENDSLIEKNKEVNIVGPINLEKEKMKEYNLYASSDDENNEDNTTSFTDEDKEKIGHVELLEKWKVK